MANISSRVVDTIETRGSQQCQVYIFWIKMLNCQKRGEYRRKSRSRWCRGKNKKMYVCILVKKRAARGVETKQTLQSNTIQNFLQLNEKVREPAIRTYFLCCLLSLFVNCSFRKFSHRNNTQSDEQKRIYVYIYLYLYISYIIYST